MRIFGRVLFGIFLSAQLFNCFAQGTAFTYQGRLTDGASPASGLYDLRFTIYDVPGSGNPISGPITNFVVAVTNGLFTVPLDFGSIFNGTPRWLEIGVRPGGSVDTFTTLSPRQPITPTPYAIFAGTAGTVPNGSITQAKLAAGAAAANLQAGGQAAVGGGGVVLSEQFNATELLNAGYQKIGRVSLVDEEWLARASGPMGLSPVLARRGHSSVWTGTEMIIWGGVDENGAPLNTGARYRPSAGTWTLIGTSNAPMARAGHSAVWTGTEMIVYGGQAVGFFGGATVTNTGARYSLATDTWTPITSGGGNRQNHFAFWTGSEMLVWGGTAIGGGIFGSSGSVPNSTGARYNPATDSWTGISNSGRPTSRLRDSAVFTGTDLIVWGGYDDIGSFITTRTNFNDGARYNLAANTWTPLSTAGAPFRRHSHSAVWTGTEMIVWGGRHEEGSVLGPIAQTNYNNGARYNPAANTWTPMSVFFGLARYGHDAVWTGEHMLIWGGTDGTNLFNSGGRYSPGGNIWGAMSSFGVPAGRTAHRTLWTGTEMIVWGGFNQFLRDLGGRYNPVNDTWTATPSTGERSKRRGHTAIWTGSEVLIWGGFDGERYLNTGGRYVPSLNQWMPITTNGAPLGRTRHTAVWTGADMIIWGGEGPNYHNTGARYNPTTGTWTPTAIAGAPSARVDHVAVWTGSQMIVWSGFDQGGANTGARYNPANNTWSPTTTTGAPAGRVGAAAVWTGTEMLVWGGSDGATAVPPSPLSTGGRYNPVANTWAALPTANAPAARAGHRAVWTGDEMLVWGGNNSTNLNTGGRYNRAANTWAAITEVNAPGPRREHTAVWDGTRMIVWGGVNGESFLRDGGIYNPLTDGWVPTLVSTNAPPARALHAAVWTGSEMVVHGGYSTNQTSTEYKDDTWHYVPPRTMFLYLKP